MAAFAAAGLALLGPVVLAAAVGAFVGRTFEPGDTTGALVLWFVMIWVTATATLVVAHRALRPLRLLAVLLRLPLSFPGRAPSRLAFVLWSGTERRLERRLATGRRDLTDDEAVRTLLTLVLELRDHDRLSPGHGERVRAYAMLIGEQLELTSDDLERLQWGALAHDVGKLAVAPEILMNDGPPTPAEWGELRSHAEAAELVIAPLRSWLGEWGDAAVQHHERFDGQGYPLGLSGHDITLGARIVAVADAYDAMTSVRGYQPAMAPDDAAAEIIRGAGTHFDPTVVRALLGVPDRRMARARGLLNRWANPALVRGLRPGATAPLAVSGLAAVTVVAVALGSGVVSPSFDRLGPDDDGVADAWAAPSVARVVEEPVAAVLPADAATAEAARPTSSAPVATSTTIEPPTSTVPPSSTSAAPTTSVAPATTTVPPADAGGTGVVVNLAPMLGRDTFVVAPGSATDLSVLDNDTGPDGALDPASVAVVVEPVTAQAWSVEPGGVIRYVAPEVEAEGATVSDLFLYRACDFADWCAEAAVLVTIEG